MPKRYMVPPNIRRLLEEAGYVWDEARQEWVNPASKRELDPVIAASLTAEQINSWIAAGRDRKPF